MIHVNAQVRYEDGRTGTFPPTSRSATRKRGAGGGPTWAA